MKSFVPTLMLLFLTTGIFAQSRGELKHQVTELSSKLDSTQTNLSETKKALNKAEIKVTSLETEVNRLQETNDELLSNMNKFLSASTQQSNSINKTLEALNQKEEQIKEIRDTYSTNDSIALLVLTDLKKTLGEDAQIGVESGSIAVKITNSFLYGDKADNAVVETSAKDFIGKIVAVANKYSTLAISVKSNGGEMGVNALRAAAVVKLIHDEFEVSPERLKGIIEDGASDATYVLLHPRFDSFYLQVREHIKNGN